MTTINLKRYYPYMTENVMLEVSDEIAATLSMGGAVKIYAQICLQAPAE